MLETDRTGKTLLTFEATGRISRIPIERRGTSSGGHEWVLGGVALEVFEEGVEGSAQLYITTWDEEKIELINRIGVGKNVKVKYRLETREKFNKLQTDVLLVDIAGMSDDEDFLYRKDRS